MQAVYDETRPGEGGIDGLSEEISRLHNEGLIDAITEFGALRNSRPGGSDFFITRYVFEKALPYINASIETVLPCVVTLCKEAGQDGTAGAIFNSYADYCTKDPIRPKEALKLIKKNPADFALALSATIDAGSRHDWEFFLAEAGRLMRHGNLELRSQATFALSIIARSGRGAIPQEATAALSDLIAAERDDFALRAAIKATVALQKAGALDIDDAVAMLINALAQGGEQSLHVVSELLWLDQKEIPAPLLDLFLSQLIGVDPKNVSTIRNIDLGIAELIKGKKASIGLDFLENLLIELSGRVDVSSFGSTMHSILADRSLLGKVVTRWLVKQEPALWHAVGEVVNSSHGGPLHIGVEPTELPSVDLVHLLFVARKALGFFFIKAASAASFIVSLMRIAPDEQTLRELSKLLYDPLLMNYPGGTQRYLAAQASEEPAAVRKAIEDALAVMEQYLGALRSVPMLPALHPSRAQRETYQRRMSAGMAESMRAAEKNSPILGLFSRSVLLYGNKSITHIHVDEGEPRRMEIPLQSHSIEMEFPRIENIDPFGLNYVLRVFRAERISE